MNVQTRYFPGSRQHRLGLALSHELRSGEKILWSGEQIGSLNPLHFGIYLFAVPWTTFSFFWTAMAVAGVSTMQEDVGGGLLAWAFPLFGTPFIAVGIGMMALPFQPWWERGKVLYAITNERVLKLRLGRQLKVDSCPKNRIGTYNRIESRKGNGALRLAIAIGRDSDGDLTTDHFDLGPVADIRSAQRALNFLTGAEPIAG